MQMRGFLKYVVATAFGLALVSGAQAGDADTLKASIFKLKGFKADYTQKVVSAQGKVLQTGSGSIEMLRPNLFRMEVVEPGEALLLADGSNVYNYDEMLEQVTIYRQENAVGDSPFMLLVSEDQALWASYNIKMVAPNSYEVTPKNKAGLTKGFRIDLDPAATIKRLVITESDGRTNSYEFKGLAGVVPQALDFKYSIPEGLTVDDQRSK